MNLSDVRKELSGDEKVLESAFKLETFYRKYKVLIWITVIALLGYFITSNVMDSMHEKKLEEANKAFLILQNSATDTKALATLKENNPLLSEFFIYAQAIKNKDIKALTTLSKSSNEIISDMSKYGLASLENKNVDSTLFSEMAMMNKGYLAITSGDMNTAKEHLNLIDEKSPLYMMASVLKHYTIKAK